MRVIAGVVANPESQNLQNQKGMPVVPYKTFDWPGVTK